MRSAGRILATFGILFLCAAVSAAGNHVTLTIGLTLTLAGAACANRADNRDLRYGGGVKA